MITGIAERYFRGNIRIGTTYWAAMNVCFPWGFIEFGRNHVVLGWKMFFLQKSYAIPYSAIFLVKYRDEVDEKNIQIMHKEFSVPVFVLFSTKEVQTICDIFENKKILVKQQV